MMYTHSFGRAARYFPERAAIELRRKTLELSTASRSRCRHRRGAERTWLPTRRPAGSPASERTRVSRADLCLRLAGSDRGSGERPVIGGRNRSHPRRRKPARHRPALVAAGTDRAASVAAGARRGAAGRCGRFLSGSNLRSGRDPGSHLHERHNRPPQRRCGDPRQYPGGYRPHQLLAASSRRRRASPRGADFSHLDFPFIFAAPAFGTCQITIPKFSRGKLLRDRVTRARQSHRVGADDDQSAHPIPGAQAVRPEQPGGIAYGGSPMAPELVRRTREVLPHVKLIQGYGLTETGLSYRPAGP